MKLKLDIKRVTSEHFLATLAISEKGKLPKIQEFVATEEQIRFFQQLIAVTEEGR